MNCQQAKRSLSLYLYGELEFAEEEELERHLDECPLCERALAREKAWHTAANAEKMDVPLDLLARCRQDLRNTVRLPDSNSEKPKASFRRWMEWLDFSPSSWSFRIAIASFLVFIGFGLGQFVDRRGGFASIGGASEMGLLNPYVSHIRDIQPGNDGRVRIIFDQTREGQLVGDVNTAEVRRLLLTAVKDVADPGVQVDSVNILKNQSGNDVRDALLDVVQHDPNAGVRIKALEALQGFAADAATQRGVAFVLEHDSNPGVRLQAIDLLAPVTGRITLSPELVGTLEQVMRSQQDDDYLRMRCLQMLQETGALSNVY